MNIVEALAPAIGFAVCCVVTGAWLANMFLISGW